MEKFLELIQQIREAEMKKILVYSNSNSGKFAPRKEVDGRKVF